MPADDANGPEDPTGGTDDPTNDPSMPVADPPTAADTDLAGASTRRVGVVVLAAGTSSRFETGNQLLAEIDGEPLVRHATRTMLASPIEAVVVVLGHDRQAVRRALSGLDVGFVRNDDYAAGQSTSVRAGIEAARERE
jgi:molybdenum cofactor cytidylyltransferase